jgi:hypothetical protein
MSMCASTFLSCLFEFVLFTFLLFLLGSFSGFFVSLLFFVFAFFVIPCR